MGIRVCTGSLPPGIGLLYRMALLLRVANIRRQLRRHHRQYGEGLCVTLSSRSAYHWPCHCSRMVFHTGGVAIAAPGISFQHHDGQMARLGREDRACCPHLPRRGCRRRVVVLVPDRDPQRRIVDIQQWRRCKFFGECLENAERESGRADRELRWA
jgi:hypothetical protein